MREGGRGEEGGEGRRKGGREGGRGRVRARRSSKSKTRSAVLTVDMSPAPAAVMALHRRRLAVTGGARVPKKLYVSFFYQKLACCVFFHFLSVHHQSVLVSQPNNFADRQYARMHWGIIYGGCHVQVALLLSFLGFPWCQFFGCLRLVEVFAAVPLGVSCFLSCRVTEYFVVR